MNLTELNHPARYGKMVLDTIADAIEGYERVLDPFAGTGLIHTLGGHETVGVEIEPEWASMHPQTIVGDATDLPFPDASFDAIATSPVFGNRMSDHHNARDSSKRITYRHTLGRELHKNNAGRMQWGDDYRDLHEQAWAECHRVLRPGGRFALNIKDHIRAGEKQEVVAWHTNTIINLGFTLVASVPVYARGMRFGENRLLRTIHEFVVVFDKPNHIGVA